MLYKQPNGTLKEKYPELVDLITESREYINKKTSSKSGKTNNLDYIYHYFKDAEYKLFKNKYSDMVYWILKEDYEYNSLVAHISAKYMPMPAESEAMQKWIIGFANASVGRTPGFADPLSVITGVDKEKLLQTQFKQEYFMNLIGAGMDGAIWEVGNLFYDLFKGNELNLGEGLLVWLGISTVKELITTYQHKEFKKGNYHPNYGTLLVPSSAVIFTLFAINSYYLNNKEKMDSLIEKEGIIKRSFNDISNMGHYFKQSLPHLDYDKIHAYPENMRRVLPAADQI